MSTQEERKKNKKSWLLPVLLVLLLLLDIGLAGFVANKVAKKTASGAEVTSMSAVNVADNGDLLITLSNGTIVNAGSVKGDKGDTGEAGQDGKDGTNGYNGEKGEIGRGILSVAFNKKSELIVTYTDKIGRASCRERV